MTETDATTPRGLNEPTPLTVVKIGTDLPIAPTAQSAEALERSHSSLKRAAGVDPNHTSAMRA